MSGSRTLGVDLGTTYTCAHQDGHVVNVSYNVRVFPSVVAIDSVSRLWSLPKQGELPSKGVYHLPFNKLIIGRREEDGLLESQISLVPHAKLDGARPYYEVKGRRVYPEEVAGYLLGKFFLKKPDLTKLVIATPAYFTHQQRIATVDAACIGGFDSSIISTVPEPVAALIDYLMHHPEPAILHDKVIVVKDIGGGTTDVTAVRFTLADGRYTINTLATAGNNWLGGQDFTESLRNLVLKKASNPTLSDDEMAELLQACDEQKQELSQAKRVNVPLPDRKKHKKAKNISVSREEFEVACEPFLKRIEEVVADLLSWRTDASEPELVLLVGGSCLMPAIPKATERRFPRAKIEVVNSPEEAISRGASLLASKPNIEVKEVLPRGLSVEMYENEILVPKQLFSRNTPLPNHNDDIFQLKKKGEFVQDAVDVVICEGDSKVRENNIRVGRFFLPLNEEDIGQRGKDVFLDIDVVEPGSIAVTARVGESKMKHVIKPLPRIAPEELQKMRSDTRRRLLPHDEAEDYSDTEWPDRDSDWCRMELNRDGRGEKEDSSPAVSKQEPTQNVGAGTEHNVDQGNEAVVVRSSVSSDGRIVDGAPQGSLSPNANDRGESEDRDANEKLQDEMVTDGSESPPQREDRKRKRSDVTYRAERTDSLAGVVTRSSRSHT